MHTQKPLKMLVVFMLVMCFALSGCSEPETIEAVELTAQIKSKAEFTELNNLSGDQLFSYFGFSDQSVHRYSVLISTTGESADTIAAFEVKNNEQRSEVINGISKYINKISSLGATIEAESTKIKNRLLYELDDTVVLVICSNVNSVKDYLTELNAKPIS